MLKIDIESDHCQVHLDIACDLAVMGPSGAGKSSLLKCIAGLVPYKGKIELDGVELKATGPKRNVAIAWQDPHLISGLTVKENLCVSNYSPELVDLFGIGDLLDRYPHQISGGEAQRVNLVRCLASSAKVILLDEPMQGLDPVLIRKLLKKIKSYCRRNKKQIFVVTHELYHVYGIFEQGLLLRSGVVHEFNTIQSLYNNPLSPWAANFFGPYVVLDRRDLMQFEHHFAEDPCLVRPEWFKIKREKEPNARVLSVVWNGPSQKVNVQLFGTAKPLTVEVNTDQSFVNGEKVYVNFKKCSRPSWVRS